MRRSRSLAPLGAVALLGGACTPDLEPIRWEPVDIDALREAIANPTGIVDEASANEVALAVVEQQQPYAALAAYLDEVFAEAEAEAEAPVWRMPRTLDGTSVYVLVACPGPPGAADSPFSHGSMRIDSPSLNAELVSTFAIVGHVRLSFSDCEIDDYVFSGEAPAFRAADPLQLGFEPTLEVIDLAAPDQPIELLEPAVWDPLVGGSVLFELDSGTTLALDWNPDTAELALRGQNGALLCTITDAELDCVPP